MRENEKIVTHSCPNCGASVNAEAGSPSIKCPYCDHYFDPSASSNSQQFASKSGSSNFEAFAMSSTTAGLTDLSAKISGIQNAENAYAYAEAYFDEYDWNEFGRSGTLLKVGTIDTLLEKIKLTCATDVNTWLLDFDSVAVPVSKKLEIVPVLIGEMVDTYKKGDEISAFNLFDDEQKVVKVLVNNKEQIKTHLAKAIERFEKFGGKKEQASVLNKKAEVLGKQLDELKTVDSIFDIREIKKIYDDRNEEIANKLATLGIDAESTYLEAKAKIEAGELTKGLDALSSLQGYKDSAELFETSNRIFELDDYICINKTNYYHNHKKIYKNVTNADGTVSRIETGGYSVLYEVVDNKPVIEKPLVDKISYFITTYGTRFFYLSIDNKLHVFDFANKADTIIESNGGYDLNNVYASNSGTKIHFEQINPAFVHPKTPNDRPKDRYRLITLTLNATGGNYFSITIPNLESIVFKNDRIVAYRYNKEIPNLDKPKSSSTPVAKKHETIYKYVDLETMEHNNFFGENDHVLKIEGSKVYFARYDETPYNLDLYVADLNDINLEPTKLLDNIHSFFNIYENKIFYTVGRSTNNTLFSYDLDTHEKIQVIKYFKNVIGYESGWFLVYKGDAYNNLLLKIKSDGSKIMYICNDIDEIITVKNGFIFYISTKDELKKVRIDGEQNSTIIHGVSASDILDVGDDKIYFMFEEAVDVAYKRTTKRTKDYGRFNGAATDTIFNSSVYTFDLTGNDIQKIIFNVNNAKFITKNEIVYCKDEKLMYEIKNKEYQGDRNFFMTHLTFYKYNVDTEATTLLYRVGSPKRDFEIKKGCFKRTKKIPFNYELVEIAKPF